MALDFDKAPSAAIAKSRMNKTSSILAGESISKIDIDKIHESELNDGIPMEDIEELADSINKVGLLEPLIIYMISKDNYEIISGHRRYAAVKHLGWKSVSCIVRKYEPDIHVRFKMHADANIYTRKKNLRFWIAEIRNAEKILDEDGIYKSKEERTRQISEMLGNGASVAQIYRLKGIAKMEECILKLDKYGLSAAALYTAVSLSPDEQQYVAERVIEYMKQSGNEICSSREFARIVKEVKEKPKTRIKYTYKEKIEQERSEYIKRLKNIKTKEDKEIALKEIEQMKLVLKVQEEKIEKMITPDQIIKKSSK